MGGRHPMQVTVRCAEPSSAASLLVRLDSVVSLSLHDDRRGMLISTTDLDAFYTMLNRLVTKGEIDVESVTPADDDVQSVYRYLIDDDGGPS
jgi:ABC-2 type transport system ATP-binding protein